MKIQNVDEVNEMMSSNKLRNFPSASRGRERLFPFARPAIALSRKLPDDPSFFIAGNCFARGLENTLRRSGFRVLSSNFSSDLKGDAVSQFQNFNSFNIDISSNEIAWATGQASGMEQALVNVGDEWADMQVHFTVAGPYEEMVRRRSAFNAMYAPVRNADIVILIVGGRRAWFDRRSGLYLNAMPTRKMTQQYPDRFELHSFDVVSAEQRIERAIFIVRNANPSAHILLVNSPVFQPSSASRQDALIDQTLGKSVQRVAIENVISRDTDVDYLPAYEIVTLSDYQHSFMPNSPNHTLPDLASRVAADLLAAGGITDARQERVAAQGFGMALLRAREFEAAEKLLEDALLMEDGSIRTENLHALGSHRLYLQALQSQGKRRDAIAHGVAMLRAYDSERPGTEEEEEINEIDAAIAARNRSPLEAFVQVLSHIVRSGGSEEERKLFNGFIHKHELTIDKATATASDGMGSVRPEVAEIKTALREQRDEDVLSTVKKIDAIRGELLQKERLIVDRAALQAGGRLKRGGEVIERALSIIESEGVGNANLHQLCNLARSQGSADQINRLIEYGSHGSLSEETSNQLRQRCNFLRQKANRAI